MGQPSVRTISFDPAERTSDSQQEEFAARRAEIAASAMLIIGELGYARVTLRDVAERTGADSRILHYYFADKHDLVSECVRLYKVNFTRQSDALIDAARTPEELGAGLGTFFATTIREEAPVHLLWYDLRRQSIFEPALRDSAADVERGLEAMTGHVLARFSELSGLTCITPPQVAYRLLDGLFQDTLKRYLNGEQQAPDELYAQITDTIIQFFTAN